MSNTRSVWHGTSLLNGERWRCSLSITLYSGTFLRAGFNTERWTGGTSNTVHGRIVCVEMAYTAAGRG